ncbi:UbiA family prenyltransferase [Flagellimonas pacifica]|uniref:4-hydroxybenzoate polyprenyltransferase n=1 Tax=Flagellimonas pacifica TaxID=1247520 RepID=A0A285MBW6_9FLAO|nr:UbiA family prenyltransferase [Allomuricauda parva]SNY94629.1 4-hydroxybenzoate polyprenyltransferase [Allomuricauda parva]
MDRFLLDLKISRPGLWFPTIWIYLVPFGNQEDFLQSFTFWAGLLFVSFPLNYLVYGLNDYKDFDADKINQRKGNYLFGAKANKEQLKSILGRISLVILPFVVVFTMLSGVKMLILLIVMVFVNIIYNFEPFRLKGRPPFEILMQSGYVLTAFFCILLNELPTLPWQTVIYLALFAFQAHIAGEIMDIEPDRQAGKATTAVVLGRKKTKILMLVLLVVESYLLLHWFNDLVLASFLMLFSIWLILDAFFIFKDKPYSQKQMLLFGYAINISAILSMIWVLYSAKLLEVQ